MSKSEPFIIDYHSTLQSPSEIQIREGNLKNLNGARGEILAILRLTEGNYFRAYFLGDKVPTVDILLEITDLRYPYFAFIQVKTTEKKTPSKRRIDIKLSEADKIRIQQMPLPTYVVGVNLDQEEVYFYPLYNTHRRKYSSIPTKYKLKNGYTRNKLRLEKLREDIIYFSKEIINHKLTYKSLL